MPRNMSFMLTTEQMYNKTKTVTRRLGWAFLKPGDIIQAVEKCQGLKKGQKIKKICLIRIVSTWNEPLYEIYWRKGEMEKEGFPKMQPEEFVKMFQKANKKIPSSCDVNRIEFEFID